MKYLSTGADEGVIFSGLEMFDASLRFSGHSMGGKRPVIEQFKGWYASIKRWFLLAKSCVTCQKSISLKVFNTFLEYKRSSMIATPLFDVSLFLWKNL
jgi:hypothetical protein